MRTQLLLCLPLLALGITARAQNFSTSPCPPNGGSDHDGSWFGSQEHACELRRTLLPANGSVKVTDSNGSIEVVGENRNDIALEARVTAQASSQDDAVSLLHQVNIVTQGDIHADGPHSSGLFHNSSWSVSYKLRVPHRLAIDLNTSNGAISVAQVEGGVEAGTVNGGVRLSDVGGDVHAHTTNGGIAIALGGDHWHGNGLSAKTVNGGITVKTPDSFSAHLVAQTVNGGIALGFPGADTAGHHHHVDLNIGSGGPTLDLETVNGGIAVNRGGGSDREAREE